MAIDVCIPWRSQPERLPAFKRVKAWYEDRGYNVITADSRKHETFNVAASRNLAVSKATSDVVVVADADTIPDETALSLAVQNPVGVVYPFDRYRYLTEASVALPESQWVVDREYRQSVGGMVVATRTTYWALGGQDERFARWGYEDNAFHLAASTLSTVSRIPGVVHAFGHDADRDLSAENPGRSRCQLYRFAEGKPDVMRELIPQR
jgi:hypothetical protein